MGERRAYSNGERRRSQIVRDACDYISLNGSNRLTLRELSRGIGVSHSILIHHFGSLEGVLEAVLSYRQETTLPWRESILRERGLFEQLPLEVDRNRGIPHIIQLDTMLNAEATNPSHPKRGEMIEHNRRFLASIREELGREKERGRVRDDVDLDAATREIVAFLQGLQQMWLMFGDDEVDMQGLMRDFLSRYMTQEAASRYVEQSADHAADQSADHPEDQPADPATDHPAEEASA